MGRLRLVVPGREGAYVNGEQVATRRDLHELAMPMVSLARSRLRPLPEDVLIVLLMGCDHPCPPAQTDCVSFRTGTEALHSG